MARGARAERVPHAIAHELYHHARSRRRDRPPAPSDGRASGRRTRLLAALARAVRLVAGVDGGQSSTVALVAGRRWRGARQRPRRARRRRRRARRGAADARRRSMLRSMPPSRPPDVPLDQPLEAVVAAISGYDDVRGRPRDTAARAGVARRRSSTTRTRPGAALSRRRRGGRRNLVIAGTGSIALGRARGGAVARAGGWGYLFGDEGSAFWLARRALSLAMESDGSRRAAGDLGSEALRHFGLDSLGDVAHGFARGSIDRPRIAAFAPRVCASPRRATRSAQTLVARCGRTRSRSSPAVVHARLGTDAPSAVSYHGGLFADARCATRGAPRCGR